MLRVKPIFFFFNFIKLIVVIDSLFILLHPISGKAPATQAKTGERECPPVERIENKETGMTVHKAVKRPYKTRIMPPVSELRRSARLKMKSETGMTVRKAVKRPYKSRIMPPVSELRRSARLKMKSEEAMQ